MLIEEIKRRITAAMKAGSTIEKDILRLALGEVQTAEARGTTITDEGVAAIIRKIIKSNEETLAATEGEEQKRTLATENAVLASLLPKSLGVEDIIAALAPSLPAIKAAGNDGQATGIAMKQLKTTGAVVNGKDVTEAVKRMRGA
jgi:uncharacterized protein YqeY